MDDIYIIHYDKKYLLELLNDISDIADKLGLTINLKKTHISKINKTFIYLKIKYCLLEEGTLIRKLHRDSITRERRRLKRYAKSNLPYKTIEQAYFSWRGTTLQYDSKKSVANLDMLYNELFIKPFILGIKDNH